MSGTGGLLFPVLVAHIVSGFVGMFGGLVPLVVRKGGPGHRRWGRVFAWAMLVAGGTALPLAAYRSDVLQAVLGVLAGYAALLGWRTGRRRTPNGSDRAAVTVGAVAFVGLLAVTPSVFARGEAATGRTAAIFAGLGLALAVRDLRGLLAREESVPRRILDHILATSLALVVAWSSFLNTQMLRLTGQNWPIDAKMLLPFVVALPLLVFWLPRWSGRLREFGVRAWTGGREPSEVERLRGFGLAEGASYLMLLFVAVPVKRLAGEPTLVKVLGPIHGAMAVLYTISVLLAARSLGWRWPRTLGALGAGVVPFGTFVLDARLRRTAREVGEEAA
jgi:integral membrane protein